MQKIQRSTGWRKEDRKEKLDENVAEEWGYTSSDTLPFISLLHFSEFNRHKERKARLVVTQWDTCACPWGSDLSVRTDLPRTCFSRPSMTWTACCRMTSLVWALSLCRWTWHILPSSLKASLMSRTRIRSLALLASRRSRSLCSFSSAVRFSSVTGMMLQPGGEFGRRGWLINLDRIPCVWGFSLNWSWTSLKCGVLLLSALIKHKCLTQGKCWRFQWSGPCAGERAGGIIMNPWINK